MGQSSGMIIALTAVFTALELFSVGLRMKSRQLTKVSFAVDDYLVLAAAV